MNSGYSVFILKAVYPASNISYRLKERTFLVDKLVDLRYLLNMKQRQHKRWYVYNNFIIFE